MDIFGCVLKILLTTVIVVRLSSWRLHLVRTADGGGLNYIIRRRRHHL